MAKRIIKGALHVSLSEYSNPEWLKDKDDAKALLALTFSQCDLSSSGYSKAGTATVTVTLDDEKTLVENKAESLRAEIKKVRAESQNAITELTKKLSSLLAIAA